MMDASDGCPVFLTRKGAVMDSEFLCSREIEQAIRLNEAMVCAALACPLCAQGAPFDVATGTHGHFRKEACKAAAIRKRYAPPEAKRCDDDTLRLLVRMGQNRITVSQAETAWKEAGGDLEKAIRTVKVQAGVSDTRE